MPPTERAPQRAHNRTHTAALLVSLFPLARARCSCGPSYDAMSGQYVSLAEVLSVLARPLEEKAIWALLRATSKAISDHEPSESSLASYWSSHACLRERVSSGKGGARCCR